MVKRFKIDLQKTSSEIKKQIRSDYENRKDIRDKSVIGAYAKSHKIHSGKTLRKLELQEGINPLGIKSLFKFRTGAFRFTEEYVRIMKISPAYKGKCICCKKDVKETLEHLFLNCEKFTKERKIYLNQILTQLKCVYKNIGRQDHNIIINLLGGKAPASVQKHFEMISCSARYLSSIIPLRADLIKSAMREYM